MQTVVFGLEVDKARQQIPDEATRFAEQAHTLSQIRWALMQDSSPLSTLLMALPAAVKEPGADPARQVMAAEAAGAALAKASAARALIIEAERLLEDAAHMAQRTAALLTPQPK